MGCRLNLKWGGLSGHSPLSTSTSYLPSSYSCRSRNGSYFLTRLSVLYSETETVTDTSLPRLALGKGSNGGLYSLLDNDAQTCKDEDKLANLKESHFRLLMKNLGMLEEMFADSNVVRLEQDILEQLERLGALNFFHSCLSKSSTSFDFTNNLVVEQPIANDDHVQNKVIVRSGKKEVRKLRRKRTLENNSESPLEALLKKAQLPKAVSARSGLKTRERRPKRGKNETEMATAVKAAADLEKVKMLLEERGEVASLSNWAEAAGITKKELRLRLYYGWRCTDELLRSMHSLVVFIGRSYRGRGIAFQDIIQAGSVGVLRGAERFDATKGYQFSTYVQFWIKKSISMMVAKYGRGVRVPNSLSIVMNKVQKARKTLKMRNGWYPNDYEIAEFTGLSIRRTILASRHLRVARSLDQNVGRSTLKYTDIIPDTSILSPEEVATRERKLNDVHMLLNRLEPREKQVIALRFGLGNHHRTKLEEVGRLVGVSTEWARRIETKALTKLRSEDSLRILIDYSYSLY